MARGGKPGFEAGDYVRLKSGGRIMTIERVDYEVAQPYARCAFSDARDRIQFVAIGLAALVRTSHPGDDLSDI